MYQDNPAKILQHLGSFWQHFGIHKRNSDFSGKPIISVFSPKCPYPVWHKDELISNNNPPSQIYNNTDEFWEQIWELFSKCPIAHNISIGNENCEYTDDCWYSKNCYLSHSILQCGDIRYCFRVLGLKDCQFSVFSFYSQKCIDLIYSYDCYQIKFAIDSKRCKNSAFLFDCQDCEDCLLCWNLRNKKYCIGNEQFTQKEYESERKKYDLTSRTVYEILKNQFSNYIKKNAWWKAVHFENIENSTGDYISNSRNSLNCFMLEETENCKNSVRGHGIMSSEYSTSVFNSEKVFYSTLVQENCYNIRFCCNIVRSRNLEYCMNCTDCEDCFFCASLQQKKYHILNKEYSKEAYEMEKTKIIEDMKLRGIYGEYFPLYFSPTSYNESMSGSYMPLSLKEQKEQGFRVIEIDYGNMSDYKKLLELPEKIKDAGNEVAEGGYWDDISERPFQILKEDIEFYKDIGAPLNDRFYIRRLKENFAWMFPSFELRKTTCAMSKKEILTTLPSDLNGRILSIEEYEKLVY